MKLIIYVLILVFYSCNTTKINKDYYIRTYKGDFIKACLKKGYNDKAFHKLIISDKSFSSDFLLGIDEYNKIDSLAVVINNEIIQDSIKSLNKAEGSRGKKILEKCICFYESAKLDSIAKKAFINKK